MIRIVWNNLIPPGYYQPDIIRFLLTPAIFDNPEIKEYVHQSTFYQQTQKSGCIKSDFPTLLTETKADRTRLFSYTPQSSSINERMMELLLVKTEHENIPYTINTYPIRHAFKQQWIKILTPVSEAQKSSLTPNKKGFFYTSDNRRLLTEDEVSAFKKYIAKFWTLNSKPDDFRKYKETYSRSISGKGVNAQYDECKISFSYKDHRISLDTLLNSIQPFDYFSSPYQTERTMCNLKDEDNLFFERLATMSVIACVWYIWENAGLKTEYAEQIIRLFKMIFPSDQFAFLERNNNTTTISGKISESSMNEDTIHAEENLTLIEAKLSQKKYNEAGDLCMEIFDTYKNASDKVVGTALSYLINCCENGFKKPSKFKSIEDIKREAVNRNCIYLSRKRSEIKSPIIHSTEDSIGLFTLNCQNAVSQYIIDTAPKHWTPSISKFPENTVCPQTQQKMILVHNDYSVNLQDALNILNRVKKSIIHQDTSLSDWKNLEIYIRCNEEEVTPLIDTALSYFTEDADSAADDLSSLIRIYLIDEAKRGADYLFARHPHFYPLTLQSNKNDRKKAIHIVIVSDNSNPHYAKWLIKEGFWTLPRFDKNISSRITLISPYASETGYSLISECPGLEGYSFIDGKKAGKNLDIDDINFPSIEYRQTSFSDRSLANELKNTISSEDFLYFIIDTDSDIKSIQLGTSIRELVIRKVVLSGRIGSYFKKDYTIAIRCSNPDYAGLAQDLIIPKEEEHSNRWFNDYNFITWGSMEDLYAWDQLDGGILEKLSQCIHLQYCNSSFSRSDCEKHLTSYFRRLYNHDSSFAAAVSLPYRLYEAEVFPRAWFIQNPDAWWNDKIRQELATTFHEKLFPNDRVDKNLLQKLAQYEHMRWCCYQLTRGWLPVDAEQVIQYIKAGATRHSLQIARLHPCICSWKNLKILAKELSDAATCKLSAEEYYGLTDIKTNSMEKFIDKITPLLDERFKKYFTPDDDYTQYQCIDLLNIRQTSDILAEKWNLDKILDLDEKIK